jgi:hypothetical protein
VIGQQDAKPVTEFADQRYDPPRDFCGATSTMQIEVYLLSVTKPEKVFIYVKYDIFPNGCTFAKEVCKNR